MFCHQGKYFFLVIIFKSTQYLNTIACVWKGVYVDRELVILDSDNAVHITAEVLGWYFTKYTEGQQQK